MQCSNCNTTLHKRHKTATFFIKQPVLNQTAPSLPLLGTHPRPTSMHYCLRCLREGVADNKVDDGRSNRAEAAAAAAGLRGELELWRLLAEERGRGGKEKRRALNPARLDMAVVRIRCYRSGEFCVIKLIVPQAKITICTPNSPSLKKQWEA